ncbi:MAG TPA: hypothetical protein PLG66_12070 [Calditrichia bacterium]|nr:hypothetical protein [Calditrichia bacterium]
MLRSRTDFQVLIPYTETPLLTISLQPGKARAHLVLGRKAYQKECGITPGRSGFSETPPFDVIKETLIQSGILEYPNLSQFLKELHHFTRQGFQQSRRPLCLALDTNLLRDRFYTTQQGWISHLPQNQVGFVVSPHIKMELNFTKTKYREKHLSYFRKQMAAKAFQKYISRFNNQNCLEDRRRRLGFLEFEKMRQKQWLIELPTLDEDELQGSGDNNIILNYRQAVEEQQIDILLLSRDSDFIAQAEGIAGIHPFRLQTPANPVSQIDIGNWEQLSQFLYCLTITYGMIAILQDKTLIHLMGIWSGKLPGDWKREELLIFMDEEESAHLAIMRQLQILKEMDLEHELVFA